LGVTGFGAVAEDAIVALQAGPAHTERVDAARFCAVANVTVVAIGVRHARCPARPVDAQPALRTSARKEPATSVDARLDGARITVSACDTPAENRCIASEPHVGRVRVAAVVLAVVVRVPLCGRGAVEAHFLAVTESVVIGIVVARIGSKFDLLAIGKSIAVRIRLADRLIGTRAIDKYLRVIVDAVIVGIALE
jgi:hypothetical protein